MSLNAIRDLVEAAEGAGWDTCPENSPILDAARDAYARLAGTSGEMDAEPPLTRKQHEDAR